MGAFTYGTLVNQKSTTINGAMTAVSPANGANLPVTDGTVFPTKGYALIEQELVHFDSVSGNNLVLNASDGRGAGGTVAVSHATLTTIYADVIVAAHFNELMANSPNSIFSAKGDLLAASAASTPARLAVGADGYLLTASSTQATGLIYTAPPVLTGLTPIADVVVSSSTSVMDFSSIPATYKHLRIVVSARSASAVLGDDGSLKLNGDSSSVYDSMAVGIRHNGVLTTAEHLADTKGYAFAIPGASASASYFGGAVISIPDYANSSRNKTYHGEGQIHQSPVTQNLFVSIREGMWKSTSPINRVTLVMANSDNFEVGSRATLYGEI